MDQQVQQNFHDQYVRYGSMLYRLGILYLGKREDAEEAMQETFIKLLYKSPGFNSLEHEKAWLLRVMANNCKDMLKSFWRRKRVDLENLNCYYEVSYNPTIFEELHRLAPKYKEVIYLYYYEGYKVGEMSEILKLSQSAIKSRLMRGRELLKLEFDGEAVGDEKIRA